jgi:hypothetical protein
MFRSNVDIDLGVSLRVGHDAYFVEDQTVPAHDLINDMLDTASGTKSTEHPEGHLTPGDISRCMALRDARSKRDNPVFSLGAQHQFFGASNASLMYDVVNGDVKTLRTILHEERFPDGFETRFVFTLFVQFSLPRVFLTRV